MNRNIFSSEKNDMSESSSTKSSKKHYSDVVETFRNNNGYGYPYESFEFNLASNMVDVKGFNFNKLQFGPVHSRKTFMDYIEIKPDFNSVLEISLSKPNINEENYNSHKRDILEPLIVISVHPDILRQKLMIYPAYTCIQLDNKIIYHNVKFAMIIYDDFKNLPILNDINVEKIVTPSADGTTIILNQNYLTNYNFINRYMDYLFRLSNN